VFTLHHCVSLRHWRPFLLLALSLVVATACIYAQATASATLLGTVKDPSGSVVPNAKVELSSAATGLKRSGVTDGVGNFRFDLLPAGSYEVKVAATGFATAVLHAVELTVSASRTVEVGLEPGKMTEVVTVEGLAEGGALSPMQAAFLNHNAAQCGFCTPGMLIAAEDLLRRCPNPDKEQARAGLAGNLCRCTGYSKIVDAVQTVARETPR